MGKSRSMQVQDAAERMGISPHTTCQQNVQGCLAVTRTANHGTFGRMSA